MCCAGPITSKHLPAFPVLFYIDESSCKEGIFNVGWIVGRVNSSSCYCKVINVIVLLILKSFHYISQFILSQSLEEKILI